GSQYAWYGRGASPRGARGARFGVEAERGGAHRRRNRHDKALHRSADAARGGRNRAGHPASVERMHELSLMRSAIGLVEEQAARERCSRVRRVHLEVGALCSVEVAALSFCFDLAARGTVAENASLEIRVEPGRRRCAGCGSEVVIASRLDACPTCGAWE